MPNYKWKFLHESQTVNTDRAKQLAAILIQLQQNYALFLKDVCPDDPDLDQEKLFQSYEQLVRQKNGS